MSQTSYESENSEDDSVDKGIPPEARLAEQNPSDRLSLPKSRVITKGGKLTEYVEKIKLQKKLSTHDETSLISPPALKRFPITQSLKETHSGQIVASEQDPQSEEMEMPASKFTSDRFSHE